jgi:hypothetical protein
MLKEERGDRITGESCVVRPRTDREAGWDFNGYFYPENATTGPMEATTAFAVGSSGTSNEVNLVVSSPVEKKAELRAYEVETRAHQKKRSGPGSATLVRQRATATARVEAETAAGVKLTVAIDCKAVGGQ